MRAPAIDPRAIRCPVCGRRIAATIVPDCPTRLPERREVERARRMFGLEVVGRGGVIPNVGPTWENESAPRGAVNTAEGLTTDSLIGSDPNGCV